MCKYARFFFIYTLKDFIFYLKFLKKEIEKRNVMRQSSRNYNNNIM